MYDIKKSPFHRNAKSPFISSNPFDSDDEQDEKQNLRQSRTFLGRSESHSVEELKNYAVHESEKTTKSINGCLKIAEDIRENATKTLVSLHHQGEQISKTHMTAVGIDHDLSRGEKLLGSLGGIFSRTWKPKKTRPISGPVTTRDEPIQRMANHFEERGKLGLTSAPKRPAGAPTPLSEPTNAQQKVEVEKAKQDDALSNLSNILGELKDMAIDMGSEIERQSQAMQHLEDDVVALNLRMRGANRRGRKLLGK